MFNMFDSKSVKSVDILSTNNEYRYEQNTCKNKNDGNTKRVNLIYLTINETTPTTKDMNVPIQQISTLPNESRTKQ